MAGAFPHHIPPPILRNILAERVWGFVCRVIGIYKINTAVFTLSPIPPRCSLYGGSGRAGGATFGRSSTVGRSSTAVGGSRTERSRLLLQVVHLEEALRIEGRRTSNVRETLERTKQAVFGLRKQLAKASDHIDGVK